MRRVVYLVFIILSSCTWNSESRPSIFIIAVEGLSFGAVSCGEETDSQSNPEGLQVLCSESVSFYHAFTPSTLSQAALASVLTALHPLEHGVRNNGSSFLSAKFVTSAEAALQKGYRTMFVSGGPPLFRKSGLAQGFELFDDSIELSPSTLYRPASEVFRLGTQWMLQESDYGPFFAVFFLADLQFPEANTKTNEGEVRELSAEAQKAEIFESLGTLTKYLKKKKLWNNSYVVLMGLNELEGRVQDGSALQQLKSKFTQVTLLIKPARRGRDDFIQWGIDKNVSLVDLGFSLFEFLRVQPPVSQFKELQAQSLLEALKQAELKLASDRLILSESAWSNWRNGAGIRMAIRHEPFLYIHDDPPKLFNTLNDRLENYALSLSDPFWLSQNEQLQNFLRDTKWPKFVEAETKDAVDTLGDVEWERAFEQRDWVQVKRLAQLRGNRIANFVASRQLKEAFVMVDEPCLTLVFSAHNENGSRCPDELLHLFAAWMSAQKEEDKLRTQERFLREYNLSRIDQAVHQANSRNGWRWDVNPTILLHPKPIDFILTLKEFEPQVKKILALSGSKNLSF